LIVKSNNVYLIRDILPNPTYTHTHTHTRARTHARTHARTRARAHTHTHTHTGCFILSDMVDYLVNRWFYWKIFRTKAWGYMMEMWTWSWVTLSKLDQGHYCSFKKKPLFFITYYCSLSRELFKTL